MRYDIYIYIYVCVCVCVCVIRRLRVNKRELNLTEYYARMNIPR